MRLCCPFFRGTWNQVLNKLITLKDTPKSCRTLTLVKKFKREKFMVHVDDRQKIKSTSTYSNLLLIPPNTKRKFAIYSDAKTPICTWELFC